MTENSDSTAFEGFEVADTDIAIVGMSGRFPGARDVEALWRTISAGESGITRFTDEELRAAGVPDELIDDPGYVKASPVIDGIESFDAGFFGVTPKEAQILDPQQRLFLEHSWSALEDAGCDPSRFDGAIGVFGGGAWSSYLQNNLSPAGVAASMGDMAVGLANDKDSLTTRVAHALGLTGPSYAVQSYCSTSLVAVCVAASSLANFECDMALAGGVAVNVPHRVGYLYQPGGIAPPDGECRAFDAAGLGAPLGSGVGVVALRRLSDALADGDRVYAVIRGWAVNNDGDKKVGFTAPGVQGQAAVIAEALAAADLTAADIDYVEAHGTGTALGDASEIAALQQVFQGESVRIGSVKTNLGHLDRAAGVTNLIKATLALHKEEIPPTRNFTEPNRQLATSDAELTVVTELTAWPRGEHTRRAGVSAFGIGGTNAHVVLQEPPVADRETTSPRAQLLVWSARSAEAADALTGSLAAHLAGTDAALGDVANTLQTGRKVFNHRRIAVATDAGSAATALGAGDVLSRVDGSADRGVAFLIAGTGEQYRGMAADLYATEPVFRDVLDHCRATLTEQLGVDPLADMLGERGAAGGLGSLLGRAEAAPVEATATLQPAMFAVQYALAKLLDSWGIRPAALAGYSVGEYVAACLAGVLSLDDALALVAHRARLIDALPAGAMAAVALSEEDTRARLVPGLDVAAVNGPSVTVVSGEPTALAAFAAAAAADDVPCRPLATTHAFHSRMLDGVREPLTEWVRANVTLNAPELPYVSNVTGALATEELVTDPAYWAEHMCAPVLFDAVLDTLLGLGDLALLELGPGQSLGTMARGHRSCDRDRWPLVVAAVPSAADPRAGGVVLTEAVGRLWLAGVTVDWAGYQAGRDVAKVGLPGYPFERQRYWIDPPAQAARPAAAAAAVVPEDRPADHVRLMVPSWPAADLAAERATVARCVLVGGGVAAEELAAALRAENVEVLLTDDPAGVSDTDATLVDLRLTESTADAESAVLSVGALLDAWGSGNANTRVLLVTRHGQAVVDGDRPDPAHAAVAAMPVVANQEYLNLDCRAIDLDADTPVTVLAAEVLHTSTDVLAAYRDGTRHVRGYTAEDAAANNAAGTAIREGGSYLVTGGLGDVGLLLAEHLAEAGAGTLVLTSRSGLTGDRRNDGVARLRERGVEVHTPAVDVTDADAMRALFAEVGPLDGVVHAAAVTGQETFTALRDLDPATVGKHFGAKVTGATVLATVLGELSTEDAPGFCVLFSSTSSILGGITFGSYAAANAALTAVAQGAHGPTNWVATCWDTWSITLEQFQGAVGAAMVRHSMSTAEGMAAFDAMIADPRPNWVVAAGGLDDRLPRAAALLDVPSVSERFPRPDLSTPYAPPLTATERALAELWTDVLGVEPIGTRDAFFELGGNSLVALQMLALVKKRFGVSVPAVTLFEAPTVFTLAAILDEQGGTAPASPPKITVAPRMDADDRRIAIIGMAGRFPGASDVDTFWRNIRQGVESVSFFTPAELRESGVPDAQITDESYVPARPVLDDVRGFDAAFFGMNPRMAALTDPQQRLFLEVCWEALEQAGHVEPEGRGRVGVYGGSNISTYLLRMPEALSSDEFSIYEVIMGNDKDALTTQASYLLDLHGPSVAVQTFCSTSLVATHLAVQALRNGECEMAIAGGVSVRVPDKVGHEYEPGGMASPDGHVRTFDAQARGSMFGDGAAVVLLKRYADAVRDGDTIHAVIRGTAMNNDGAMKVGYTAPSIVGQSRVIADAMADAGVTGDDVCYIEAHGTATELGDPIEVAALTRAFGDTAEKQYCPIGSVKTNVGHLDRAAGSTGLIKTALSLRDNVIPPSLHFTEPNPKIDFANSPFYVNTQLSPFPARDGRTPVAGLNSLGMGGTNVHVVLEPPPVRPVVVDADPDRGRRHHVLPISARTEQAVETWCARMGEHLAAAEDTRLTDLAFTLQAGRQRFEHRRALVTDGTAAAATAFATGDGVLTRQDTAKGRPVAFVFDGVGEQYPGLVRELYRREPAFAAALDECLALLDHVDAGLLTGERAGGQDLAALLGRGDSATDPRVAELERTEIAQPALFAVEYALATTLIGWGVTPSLMLGYSLGEYVAACLAGVLSTKDAIRLVAHRAKLIDALPGGGMVAVPLDIDGLASYDLAGRGLDVAATNGPQVTVVAGPAEALDALVAALRDDEIVARPLSTTHAFHSRMLAPVADELTAWVRANVTLNPPTIPYVSNVTGDRITTEQATNPAYWARHMCQTVRFDDAVATLLADPELAILEIGPGQSLGALIRGVCPTPQRWPLIQHTLPAVSDQRADDLALAETIARLWLTGVTIDWTAHHAHTGPYRIPLPTYPFQRQQYWMESTARSDSDNKLSISVKAMRDKPSGPHVQVLEPTWTATPITGEPTDTRCVVVADSTGIGAATAELLRGAGVDTVLVPGSADHTAVVAEHATDQTTVLDLRLLDHPESDVDGRDVVRPVADVLDAWGSDGRGSARVVVVTRGGQAVLPGEVPVTAHTAASILQVVANLEYLNLDCATVDLGADDAVDVCAAALAAEVCRPADVGDVLVGHRAGTRYTREFTPAAGERPAIAVRPGGTVLITGGLGDIGLLLAEHMIESGAGRLVLTSRSGPTERRAEVLARLRERVPVDTPAVDVTDVDAMRALLAEVGPLAGVVHAAAITDPSTFRALRDVDATAVGLHFGAKVAGARVLETLLAELPADEAPEFCVLFSSSSSILGGITFSCYAASNAALTAIGQRNHARFAAGEIATCWIASSWDTWTVTLDKIEVGAVQERHSMTADEALTAFDALLAAPGPWLVIAAGGLDDRLPKAMSISDVITSGERFPRPDLPNPYAPPATDMEKALAELWSHLLGIEPIGVKDAFFDLGGNSLLGLQMLALVKKRFGIAVAAVTLFEAPTVHHLAAILDGQGAVDSKAAPVVATPARTDDTDHRIAIVGMAGRFPGASDVDTFWRNLAGGVESISFFTDEELLAAGVPAEQLADPAYVPARPVLADVRGFDAAFFGLSPRMAAVTDPQQRLFLEVCWEALEQGGYAVPEHRGRVGVFGGSNISTYLLRNPEILASGDFSTYEVVMGNDKDALTTQVSYLMDLYGPSVAVQTFCSTSLVATHMAVRALRHGECEMALAGGVSVHVPDKQGHVFEAGGMASPDGHVRTFDAKARGSMFGDGAAVVLLKRLDDAVRDGDHVHAVIRGSAMNNDGALKVGYTAPSVVGQSRVVADALADAGVTGNQMSYVECHGTATELGDPIEVAALSRAFGETAEKQFCPIGSVKTNVGHLDRAAGATGLIKTAMSLREGLIPPTLHFTDPNPQIDFENSPFYVNTELSPFRADTTPIAGVSSLGMGGTNVHVVLEQAPPRAVVVAADPDRARRYHVLPVSARTENAAGAACARLAEHLRDSSFGLPDVAFTLQVGRKTFEHRRCVVADSTVDAAARLGDPAQVLARLETTTDRQVAFVFAGVGEQYPGLVRELYRREPVFATALDECLTLLASHVDADLVDLLTGDRVDGPDLAALLGRSRSTDTRGAELQRTEVAQPAMFAVEYALASTLLAWGVKPTLMLGYSLGEYVAACLAGVLTLPDAIALVAHRARLIEALPGGGMVAVALTPAELGRYDLARRGIDIAATNGPQLTVVAGPAEALDALVAELTAAEITCRPLSTTHAFHSRMLEPVAEELTTWVRDNVRLSAPTIPYLSNVTGARITAEQATNPAYWARHMCQTVRFDAAVGALLADEGMAIVEIGPGQSLGALIRTTDCPPARWPHIHSTLPAGNDKNADDQMLAGTLGKLWLTGVTVDWMAHSTNENSPGRVPLPTYPFQRQEYWLEPPARTAVAGGAEVPAEATLEVLAALPVLPEEQWQHLPVWRQTAVAAGSPHDGSWLVFTRDGRAADVVSKLGGTVTRVWPGDGFAATEDGYTIRPGCVEDSLSLLRALRSDGVPLDRVLHLWTVDAAAESTVRYGLHTLVALARAAGELGIEDWSLDVVTSGGQQVLPGEQANPYAATAIGPAMVIPLEFPTVRARLVDVDETPTAVKALLGELARPFTDRVVALRQGRRWLPGYESMGESTVDTVDAENAVEIRDEGVYLVTGGLGGIGLGMARRLAEEHRAKLVLFGRTGIDGTDERSVRRAAQVRELIELGADVEIVTGDVADPDDVRRAVTTARQRFGALHGVLHAAGLPGMGLMQFKDPAELDQVLAPKVGGALAIAEALQLGKPDEIELDFLVLFSSITSATGGGPGQVDYCSANAFLDGFAHQLAAGGRRVVSIDWGEWLWNAWDEGLAGYAESLQEFLRDNRERVGIAFDAGWRSLLRALGSGEPRVIVSTQDFATMVRFSSQFTLAAVTSQAMAEGGGQRHPRPELLTPYQEPTGRTEETIAEIWGAALRLERVGVADNFFELGGNSLLGVAIVASLRREFQLAELPPHILYEAPTVAALAEVVENDKAGGGAPVDDGESIVRAQLRRSGLAAAAKRRGR